MFIQYIAGLKIFSHDLFSQFAIFIETRYFHSYDQIFEAPCHRAFNFVKKKKKYRVYLFSDHLYKNLIPEYLC